MNARYLRVTTDDLRLMLTALRRERNDLRKLAEESLDTARRHTRSEYIADAEDIAEAYRQDAESLAALVSRVETALTDPDEHDLENGHAL